jgi:hypothetical protein
MSVEHRIHYANHAQGAPFARCLCGATLEGAAEIAEHEAVARG